MGSFLGSKPQNRRFGGYPQKGPKMGSDPKMAHFRVGSVSYHLEAKMGQNGPNGSVLTSRTPKYPQNGLK